MGDNIYTKELSTQKLDPKLVDSRMVSAATMVVNTLIKKGYDARVVESYRPQSRQDELYAQGRTKPGKIITKTKSSKHTEGKAVDIGLFDKEGNFVQDATTYKIIGDTLMELKLRDKVIWGGDWGWDSMHLELPMEK